MLLLAKTEEVWRRVTEFSTQGCLVDDRELAIGEVWANSGAREKQVSLQTTFLSWEELSVPLPSPDILCLAYAFTYPSHRREMKASQSFYFPKIGPAELMHGGLAFRKNLDYEVEIGLLLRHGYPDRFGFCLLNDLTDRGIQVLESSVTLEQRQKVFTKAKSFKGSLLVGPFLALGNASDWFRLEATLTVNGVIKQELRAKDCLISPRQVYSELLAKKQLESWLLVATGTPGGVVLTVPSWIRRVALLVKGKLSPRQARLLYLQSQSFLVPGDVVEIKSDALGYAQSVVAQESEAKITVNKVDAGAGRRKRRKGGHRQSG